MCILCGDQQNLHLLSITGSGGATVSQPEEGGSTLSAAIDNTPYFIQALVASYLGVERHVGAAPVITYSWEPDWSTAGYVGSTNSRSLNSQEKAQVRAAFAQWAAVADISFVEVSAGTAANIQFGAAQMDVGGYTAIRKSDISHSSIWVDADNAPLLTYLHEIGHALGLKHPGDYNGASGTGERPFLPSYEDTTANTVMSYYGDDTESLGIYDLAAIHYIYGPSKTVRAGDDPYFINAADPTRYIWDGGGIDTISAEGSGKRVVIDLNEGSYGYFEEYEGIFPTAQLLNTTGQFFIGYGTVIENAVGGYGNDSIFGNAANNRLTGGAGDDTLSGGDGEDTAVFEGNIADYTIFAGYHDITVTGRFGGVDVLSGIEWLAFADTTIATPPLATIPTTPVPVLPILTADATWVVEKGDGQVSKLTFTISLRGQYGMLEVSDTPVSFKVTTGGYGDATAGVDYTPLSQELIIPAGKSSVSVTVDVLGDSLYEENETFALVISDIQGAQILGNLTTLSATAAVVDDDSPAQFSLAAYRALNPDLAAAFGNDDLALAWHYVNYGKAEGRATTGFDAEAYAALNPDLFAAFGLNEDALINHYLTYGRAEGRATVGFDAVSYAAFNRDLYTAFGVDHTALVQHYITYGHAEGRATTGFSAEAYAAFNPSITSEYGWDEAATVSYFFRYNGNKSDATSGFDVETYAVMNPDLLSIFGLNEEALIRHFQYAGQYENRIAFITPENTGLSVLGMVEEAVG